MKFNPNNERDVNNFARHVLYRLKSKNKKLIKLKGEAAKMWRSKIPAKPGVYALFDKKDIYVGETKSLRDRMNDLRSSQNHTYREKIGLRLFNLKREYGKYKSKQDEKITDYIEKGVKLTYVPLKIGRKEVEDYITSHGHATDNKSGKRGSKK